MNTYPKRNQTELNIALHYNSADADLGTCPMATDFDQQKEDSEPDWHDFAQKWAYTRFDHLWPMDVDHQVKAIADRVLGEYLLTGRPTMLEDPDEKNLASAERLLNSVLGDLLARLEIDYYDDVAFIAMEFVPYWPISEALASAWESAQANHRRVGAVRPSTFA